MKVWRSREYQIKVQDFESHKFTASVGADHTDFGYNDESWAALSQKKRDEVSLKIREKVASVLEEELADDIAEAQNLSRNRKSFIHDFEVESVED